MPPPPGSFPETLPPGEAPAADDGFANIGLGFSNHFAPVFNTASPMSGTLDIVGTVPGDIAAAAVSPYYANLSMRYRLNPSHEIEVLLGMAYLKMTAQAGSVAPAPPNEEIALDGFLMHLGGRYLYTIAGNDRARLYTGGGLAFAVGTLLGDGDDPAHTHGWDEILYWGIMIGAPLGFEYRFEGAPQLALTIEVGIGITYIGVNTAHKPGLAGGPGAPTIEDSGGMFLFGMGQAAALDDQVYLPLIDHVSFGLHYYF
jgi:hypothetical protein